MPRFSERITYAARLAYGRWQPPALTPADAWQGFPAWLTDPDDPVRDAIGAGLADVFTRVASDAARTSTMHLRKHARGWALDLVAAGAGLPRQGDEGDDALRQRLAVVDDAVSPTAISVAVAALVPGGQVIAPMRHGLFLGRGYLRRAPVDHVATRRATDGRRRLYAVGPVRVWAPSGRGRFHVAILPRGRLTFLGPATAPSTSRLYLGRSLTAARSFLTSAARAAALPALAATLNRLRAAGVRWTASLDANP